MTNLMICRNRRSYNILSEHSYYQWDICQNRLKPILNTLKENVFKKQKGCSYRETALKKDE
jgi:hypothetical protein